MTICRTRPGSDEGREQGCDVCGREATGRGDGAADSRGLPSSTPGSTTGLATAEPGRTGVTSGRARVEEAVLGVGSGSEVQASGRKEHPHPGRKCCRGRRHTTRASPLPRASAAAAAAGCARPLFGVTAAAAAWL
eukprot:CAMPEP_0196675834 /NCGR_PEP_ID=MMETSP1090-20130531/4357_1 /TAXON_ID=37098 /ORGANISM="Isochrysis sp, Strain CCMP1244" /LENGTH=134 /DNA_ID=CAMNT_0042013717 /DNA_START=735 /DNA_END=1137 /DNA_ORIENTATION=-